MPFPQGALDAAASRRLGEAIRVFDARPGYRRAVAWLCLLGLAGVLLGASTTVYLVQGPVWLGVVGLVLAVGYLAGFGWIVRGGALRGRGLAIYLFEYGIVRRTRRGQYTHRWNDLRAVTMSGVQATPRARPAWHFTVAAAGARFTLGPELPDVRQLGEIMIGELAARLVPRYAAAVEAGKTVRIGPFEVSSAGVAKDGEFLPWPAVADVGMANGLVYVRDADDLRPLTATVGTVPNAVVLLGLCERVRSPWSTGIQ
jgi:uncharacterized protein DUF6585